MLSETEIRKIKRDLMECIRYDNEDVSKLLQQIEEKKQNIRTYQAKLDEINKVLKDQ